ncbi:OmpA family protein [Rahnella laticis]|uniref:OmpA family protein n=1 Tax=Rahnella laticis TaxID=2787622 RepID=UPI0018A2EABF|nr:OmpA family protein [Rahnella laticis]MBF7997614.1 OmpA family protein [Rahnella laticis]
MRIGSRKSVYWLTALAGSLTLVLCWVFSPFGMPEKLIASVTTLVLGLLLMWWAKRRDVYVDTSTRLDNLPEASFSQPVVLVCGDKLDVLFGDTTVRVTPLACYVKTDPAKPLSVFVDAVLSQRPGWIRQMSMLLSVAPETHADEAVFRAEIKSWRQQFHRLQKRIGCRIPVLVSCWLNGPASPWFVGAADGKMVVREDETGATLLDEWLSTASMQAQSTRHVLATGLDAACVWLRSVLLDEMQRPENLAPPVRPVGIGVRFVALSGITDNLWSVALQRRTSLSALIPLQAGQEGVLPFPDPLLPLLSGTTRHIRAGLAPVLSIIILMCFAVAAIGFSLNNNLWLITRVGMDLNRYRAISMDNYIPKAEAVGVLKQDAQLLERYHRQGEPMRLGIWLYQGERLWLALQQEIDRYVPPPPPPPPVEKDTPKTVRLDALSLFDTGKSDLKPGSLKMLVNALVDIKAKPGWLIVVAGHTDITGDAKANQVLSQKRAESLRDWMLSTSDVSPTCFAVQGYGATRPIATNDTPEGRAANRRVEISLVPQADACKATATPDSSND